MMGASKESFRVRKHRRGLRRGVVYGGKCLAGELPKGVSRMEGEKLTRLLRIAFILAVTRQRKLEELERAIQTFAGAEARREQAIKGRVKLAGEINSGVGAIDGLRHLASHINDTIAEIDGMLGSLRDA